MTRQRIGIHCTGIPDSVLRRSGLVPVPSVSGAVTEALAQAGDGARVCVLPEGPETIPYVVGGS
jgi:lactate racemase